MGLRGPEPLSIETTNFRGTTIGVRGRRRGQVEERPASQPDEAVEPEASTQNYVAVADEYVADVLSGRQVAGVWVKKAAARYQRMRKLAESETNHYLFSWSEAEAICEFAERCPHIEGRWGSDTITLEPFQVFILVACYGFRVRETGRRLTTVVYFEVARKSAKSTIVAVAGLYHLAKEDEPGAQVVCAGTTGTQARIVFGIMQRMVRKSPYLRSLGLQVFANSITNEEVWSNAKPINSKSSTQDGLNPSFISFDESHAQSFELYDVLVSAMGARADGTIWCPTTAGYDMTSVGYTLRTTAMKILDQTVESDHSFVVLYELDEEDDWSDERVWVKSAPMVGITPKLDYVRKWCADVKATPAMQGEFETKMCNRWLHAANQAIAIEQWDACADPKLTLEMFVGEKCWIGVDLAERDDITAVSLNFRYGDLIVSFVKGFLPADVINERARAVPEYRIWITVDDLEATPGDMTDYNRVEAYIDECCGRFDVQDVVIERYGANHLASNLLAKGVKVSVEGKHAKVCTPPMRELLTRLKTKRFRHNGATFLRWQASNLCMERRRDGSMLPTKDSPESLNKIDAIDAILWGWHALLRSATAEQSLQIFFMGGGR